MKKWKNESHFERFSRDISSNVNFYQIFGKNFEKKFEKKFHSAWFIPATPLHRHTSIHQIKKWKNKKVKKWVSFSAIL